MIALETLLGNDERITVEELLNSELDYLKYPSFTDFSSVKW